MVAHNFAKSTGGGYSFKFSRAVLAAIAAGGLACMANAAKLDLAGADRTVTDVSELEDYDGVTNTSETQATLTFNLPNGVVQTYGGVISGNIKLVKQGDKSKLELTRANTYTGGTQIDGGVIIVSNPMACGDPTKTVVISSFNASAKSVSGPWCAIQFDVSGFSNPISLPEGTDSPTWAGNTYCNHSLCVTNNSISIYSPISGGYFAFLAAQKFDLNSGGTISDVNFYGPITCTGMKVYSGGNVHFRGAITNSLKFIEGASYTYLPKFYLYSSANNFNNTGFRPARGQICVKADNALEGMGYFAGSGNNGSADSQLLLQGHDVTIGRTRCISATVGATSSHQSVNGDSSSVLSVLRMQGGEDTVSNVRFKNNMSLIWDPTGDFEFVATSNRTSSLVGPLVVKRGTFTLDGGHTMPSVTNIEVMAGATFKVMSGSSFNSVAVMRTEPGATVNLAADATVATLKVGDRYLPAGDYVPGTYEGLTVAGATLHVSSEPYFTDWKSSMGENYPYPYPVYMAEVESGTASIEDMTFKKIEGSGASVTADVSYAEFTGSAATGTIVKRGNGTLLFNKDISSFTGPVHVEEGVVIGSCSNCFGRTVNGGVGPNQRTYVHSGATLVMDAANNNPSVAEANAVYYEGDGFPGMGGAFVVRNGDATSGSPSRWQLGVGARATGPARLYMDLPAGGQAAVSYNGDRGQKASDFNANGQDLLICGRTAESQFYINASTIDGYGNLTFSNVTVNVNGNSGRMLPKNDTSSTIRFCGGSRWLWCTTDNLGGNQNKQTATVVVDDMEYARFGDYGVKDGKNYGVNPWGVTDGTTNNWWRGPMVLNDDFRMYNSYSPRNNSDKRRFGCTFSREVSGPKGFRSWFKENGDCWGDGIRLNLLYPVNTFKGGIVLDGGSLGVWAARAVPSQEDAGLVSITNGYVYFGRQGRAPSTTKWPEFLMPVTELVGNCAVTNGTGFWQGLVKKGEGTLDYNSQLGGAYLDLQEGTVKLNTEYREEYTGENAAYAPNGYAAALPEFETLKGTAGTLDLNGVAEGYTVSNVEGTPSVANGGLTVVNRWTLDAATIAGNTANISGALTFGENATITVTGDIDSVRPRPSGGFLFARATSIVGEPQLDCRGWSLAKSGGELRLVKYGFMIIVR